MPSLAAISDAAISALPSTVFAFASAEGGLSVADTSGVYAVYAASTEFITRASDTPANTPFLGTLILPINFTQSLINSDGFGRLNIGYGGVEIINAEADYDDLVENFAVDKARVLLKVGARTDARTVGPYSGFVTVADLEATDWLAGDERLRVSVRDKSYRLEVPTQPSVYDGSGDLNGGPDLVGKRKPKAFGKGNGNNGNATPVLVIPSELVYQVNDGPVQAISQVYDSGAELTLDADYATLTLLRAATLVPGEYATCIAQGCFRLGGAPAGQITFDFEGDNSGGYVSTIADVIRRAAETAADIDDDEFDDLTFDTLNALQGGAIGYYLDENSNETVAETVGNLMGISGWGGFTRLGKFAVRRFDAPGIDAVLRFDQYDLITIAHEKLPDGIDPIVHRFRVSWGHNFTRQDGSQLVGDALEDTARSSYLAQAFRTASTSSTESDAILANHPLAKDPEPVVTYFEDEDDAQDEADRLLAIYGVERSLYKFSVKGYLLQIKAGDTIHLTYPRFDLHDGKYGRVVAVEDDVEANLTTITGFF